MRIIGIAVCPTGVAHTYTIQECLEKECKKRDFDVKIKAQGGLEIENELSEEGVAQADVVILAVSVVIEGEERFRNKRVLHTNVDEAIPHVGELVDRTIILVKGN